MWWGCGLDRSGGDKVIKRLCARAARRASIKVNSVGLDGEVSVSECQWCQMSERYLQRS